MRVVPRLLENGRALRDSSRSLRDCDVVVDSRISGKFHPFPGRLFLPFPGLVVEKGFLQSANGLLFFAVHYAWHSLFPVGLCHVGFQADDMDDLEDNQ